MSAAASELVAIGQNPAPLPLVGQFLGQVGAVVKAALDSCDTSACLCDTKVRGSWRTAPDMKAVHTSRCMRCAGSRAAASGGRLVHRGGSELEWRAA